ncbi:MAG: TonB-dependent receptor, partial [Spirosoma sp.]|nr:TonB-dependent receptor [Spirosoma sp.]
MKTKSLLIAICLLTISLLSPVQAQFSIMGGSSQPKALPGTAGDQSPKGNAKIIGSVLDSTQAKAVEFAS